MSVLPFIVATPTPDRCGDEIVQDVCLLFVTRSIEHYSIPWGRYAIPHRNVQYFQIRNNGMSNPELAEQSEQTPNSVGDELFALLGKAHTLEIVHEVALSDDPSVRFGELQERLGLSPNTLSRRLEELVEFGLLERIQYDEIPPRVEYESTEKLDALAPMCRELGDWMKQYGSERATCPDST